MIESSVKPNEVKQSPENTVQPIQHHVHRLIECGCDKDAATSLVERLTAGRPADKFEAAAMQSFIDLIADLSVSGGSLASVR